jgi:hypothetical protein
MTDQTKIPAPKPVAWADDRAAIGGIGSVESSYVKQYQLRNRIAAAERLTHPLCTLAAAETYAAALAEKARQEERERCAKLCEGKGPELLRWWGGGNANAACQECAAAIRAG